MKWRCNRCKVEFSEETRSAWLRGELENKCPCDCHKLNLPKGYASPWELINVKPFPKHWGKPPTIQTRDLKMLPENYGLGSSTVYGWVVQNIEKDKKQMKETNILLKTKTYLIGPMEYAEGRTWREEMTPFLRAMGVTVFDPYKKPFINAPEEDENTHAEMEAHMQAGEFDIVHEHFKKVRAFDLSMVDRSDFIVGYINPKTPTFGTMEELSSAILKKRPCFLVIEGGKAKTPKWIMGMMPHKYLYNNFDEVKKVLTDIDTGVKEIDSDRWRLFKPELR